MSSIACVLAVCALAPAAPAQTWSQSGQIAKPAQSYGDRFGQSVAISGDTLLAGVPDDDNANGIDAGMLLLFERSPGSSTWDKVANPKASNGVAGARFGAAVVLAGERAIAGAPGEISVYVLGRDVGGPGAWGESAIVMDPTGSTYTDFGTSLALDGERLLVGAPGASGPGGHTGGAYLFEFAAGQWTVVRGLFPVSALPADLVGHSVALSGDFAFVGAPLADRQGFDSGAVHVFERNSGGDGAWGQVATVLASQGRRHDRFGQALSASGGLLAVGAPNRIAAAPQAGVYVYGFGNGASAHQLPELARLTAADGIPFHDFGHAVAVESGRVIVGAWLADSGAVSNPGAVYVFQPDPAGPGIWSQQKLGARDPENGDGFGYAVAASGDTLLIGTPWDGGVAAEIGSAYVFELD